MDFEGKDSILQRLEQQPVMAGPMPAPEGGEPGLPQADRIAGIRQPEHALVARARDQALNATLPR
jgi:hypothetical protein